MTKTKFRIDLLFFYINIYGLFAIGYNYDVKQHFWVIPTLIIMTIMAIYKGFKIVAFKLLEDE